MTCNKVNNLERAIIRVIKYQLIQGLCAIIFLTICYKNLNALVSSVFGLVIAVFPTIVYALAMRSLKVENYGVMFNKHKKATLLKFMANMLGFFLVLSLFKSVNILALFIVYIVALSGYWTNLLGLIEKK